MADQIQKVYIYDKTGKIVKTILFQGKYPKESYKSFLETNTITTKQMIHLDDSIRIIKNKILRELNEVLMPSQKVSYKELYMFIDTAQYLDPYDAIKQFKESELDDKKTKQILDILKIDYSNVNMPSDKIYHYEDLKTLMSTHKIDGNSAKITIPLGQKFEKTQDILFCANPFTIMTSTPPEITKQNLLFNFENSLLLNYATTREPIHVCLAKDVFEFFEEKPVQEFPIDILSQIYYPFLYKDQIRNSSDLLEKQQVLLDETTQSFTENTWKLYDTVDLLYDVYSQRKSDLGYIEYGMKSFVMNINTDFVNILHLDTIFKNIHATKQIPYIKYNPGFRRENLYRLYSEKIATNGKKIPYLGYNEILKLSKDTGKTGQITMYMETVLNKNQIQLFINFNKDGKISIKTFAKSAIQANTIPTIIRDFIIPEFEKLNDLLYDTGYRMDMKQFETPVVEDIEYIMRIKIQKKMDLNQYRNCLSSIFDIESLDMVSVDGGAKMRFKRVENYEEMDRVSLTIHNEYKRTHDIEDVIQTLVSDPVLQFSEDSARDHVIQFFGEHTLIRGELLENAGFLVVFKLDPTTNILNININQVRPLAYVDILHVYMDSIVRLFQSPDTSSPINDLQTACTVSIDYKEVDRPNIDNIIASEPDMVKQIIQPVVFKEVDDEFFASSPEIEAKLEDLEIDEFEFMDVDEALDDESIPKSSIEESKEPETKPPETKPPETKPPETKPPETKPPETKPPETKPPETKPPETKPLIPEVPKEKKQEIPQQKKQPSPEEDDEFFGMDVEGGNGELEQKIEGRNLKNPNPFQEKIEKYDPALILKQDQGKYGPYSRICPPAVMRQPVLLTEEEKREIDENHPGSYSTAIKYGSDPDKQHWYICPRYWSFKTNSSISEQEVNEILKTNPNAIIPPKSRTIPKGSFIYEFNVPKEHMDEKGNYITHYPGFIRGKHPQGFNLPCCFKRMQDIEIVKEKIEKQSNYVIASNSYPIPKMRQGFLPLQIETFLQADHRKCVEKQNQAIIKKQTDCLLRFGVEQIENQSFLGVFADIYASSHKKSNVPSVKEFREILKDAIDLDMFVKYHNGSLVRVFSDNIIDRNFDIKKYSNSWFAKELSKSEDSEEMDLLKETIASYENFLKYLSDESAYIDHTYMWDMITQPNPKIIPDGLNMVILEIPKSNIVEILCPTSAYSTKPFDSSKETLIILKQDEFYEPIYLYRNQTSKYNVVRTFSISRPEEKMAEVLQFIQKSMRYNCKPHSSLPGIYDFSRPYSLKKMVDVLLHDIRPPYHIHHEVMNYQAKIVGLIISRDERSDKFFVPCSPSPLSDEYGFEFLDNINTWKDYTTTIRLLGELKTASEGKIKCSPKVKIMEENMIIGVLTETNQYIRISPPTKNISESDGLEEMEAVDYIAADKVIIGKSDPDPKRMKIIQNIRMESKLYRIFRNIVRELLSHYESRLYKIQIIDMLENLAYSYSQKISKIIGILKTVVDDTVLFENDISEDDIILSIADYKKCNFATEASLLPQNTPMLQTHIRSSSASFNKEKCQVKMPAKNYMMDIDNENLYYNRLADELLRYHRIRNFVLEPMYFLNLVNIEYKINNNEMILLESILKSENLDDMRVFNFSDYIKNISYEDAEPANTTQKYSNIVTL